MINLSVKEEMSIEEVDKLLQFQEAPSKTPAYIAIAVTIYFWVVGYTSLAMLIGPMWEVISEFLGLIGQALINYLPMVLGIIAVIFIIMLVASLIYLKLIEALAREFLIAFYILLGISLLGIGAFALVGGQTIVGAIFLLLGIIELVFFFKYKRRIELTGRMIELAGKAVYEEKGAISAVIIKSIFIALTSIAFIVTEVVTVFWMYNLLSGYEYGGIIIAVVSIIILLLGTWSIVFIDTFFTAAVVRIIHDWYRSPKVDVASFSKGIKKAWEVAGPLAKYAFVMSVLYVLVNQARRQAARGKTGLAARIIASILGITVEIVRYLGFYVIPAMVIRKAGFIKAFEDSISKLRDLFIETLAGAYAFSTVLGIIAFITAMLMGGIGYVIGVAIFVPMLALYDYTLAIGIVSGFAFAIIALIPLGFVTAAVSAAWKTMLYEYGLDLEFAMKEIMLPSRLPEDVRSIFNETLAEKGVQIPPLLASP